MLCHVTREPNRVRCNRFVKGDTVCIHVHVLECAVMQEAVLSRVDRTNMPELVSTGHSCWSSQGKIRHHKNTQNDFSLEIKQEVAHRVVARRRKKCVVDIEAERCPPKTGAKIAT